MMPGETDLAVLLRSMKPVLHDEPYGYAVASGQPDPMVVEHAFAVIREAEGTTFVATQSQLKNAGLNTPDVWARISLDIHSSLSAVGLTAAFATKLGSKNISANVIAGYYQDHIFVQWDRRHDALRALQEFSQST
jgi:hypothetical protein